MSIHATVSGLYVGNVEERWSGRPESAIAKKPVSEVLKLDRLGFETDSQADLTVHGGEEKAVHHYAAEHYEYWKTQFPEFAQCYSPGGFGENISTMGVTESNLCIGDVLELGTALVQVSQGRQPCWKLNAHTGNNMMVSRFQKTGYTGWYYRVLKAGEVQVGNTISLSDRPNENWTLKQVINARFDKSLSVEDASVLASIAELAPGWRAAFEKKKNKSYKEDTSARIHG